MLAMIHYASTHAKCQILAVLLVLCCGVLTDATRSLRDVNSSQVPMQENGGVPPSFRAQSRDQVLNLFCSVTVERLCPKSGEMRWLHEAICAGIPLALIQSIKTGVVQAIPWFSRPLCDVARHERSGVLLA